MTAALPVSAIRDRLLGKGFARADAVRLALALYAPASPQERAAAEWEEKMGPVPPPHWADVVRNEAWHRAHQLLPLWLPVTLDSDEAGTRQRRARREWRGRWAVEIDLISGRGLGLWREATTGARGADLASLFAWLAGAPLGAALRELAGTLGVSVSGPRQRRAASA